jgi:methylated-DNA-[protein]-cysteine S-methyltransferase
MTRGTAFDEVVSYERVESPIGEFVIAGDGRRVVATRLPGTWRPDELPAGWREKPGALREAAEQLDQYFSGTRRSFDLELSPSGTSFQLRVWRALEGIGFAETASYRDVAAEIGNPKATRAVGMANNRNPIALFVPCHRVIGADGSLTGYGGGLEMKTWLLTHERAVATGGAGPVPLA